jgi:hypothetical protein
MRFVLNTFFRWEKKMCWFSLPACRSTARTIFLSSAVFFATTQVFAGTIALSAFSGNETVVSMDEIPRTYINVEEPSSGWLSSRLVKGIYLQGAHDIRLPGSLWAFDTPFAYPPTDGDVNGFAGASKGVALQVEVPDALGVSYGMTMDFRYLTELPNRVGFLSSFSDTYYGSPGGNVTNPNVRLQVSILRGDSTASSYLYEAGSRLIAFEEVAGIAKVSFSTVGLLNSFYGVYSPWVTVDDVRFEAVPTLEAVPEIDPNSLGSVLALVLGSLGLIERRRRSTPLVTPGPLC